VHLYFKTLLFFLINTYLTQITL